MTSVGDVFQGLLPQIKSLEPGIATNGGVSASAIDQFLNVLEQAISAGDDASSATLAGSATPSTNAQQPAGNDADASTVRSGMSGAHAANTTAMITMAQAVPPSSDVTTPSSPSASTAAPIAAATPQTYSFADTAYNPANNSAASGASQYVNGVQIIPGAPGWDPNAAGLAAIYGEIQGTLNSLNNR